MLLCPGTWWSTNDSLQPKRGKQGRSKDYLSKKSNRSGGAGYRSRYLSHAKRALYHLSYAPLCLQACHKKTMRSIQAQGQAGRVCWSSPGSPWVSIWPVSSVG